MLIYFINLFVVVLAAYLSRRTNSILLSRCLLGIAFVSMVLVAGMRDRSVGTDTGYYVRDFELTRSLADATARVSMGGEHGYWMLIWLVHLVSDQYFYYLLAIAMIVVGCYQRAIVAYSDNIAISFFIFITLGTYTFFFNGARQGIACAIYSLAIGPMLQRQFLKYVGWVLFASLFHKTAIMMLPAYLIFSRPSTFKNNLVTVLIGCSIAVFTESVMGFTSNFEARYPEYLGRGEGGGHYMVGLSVIFAIFFLIFKKSVSIERARYDRFLNMVLFGMMIGIVSSVLSLDPSGFLRLVAYTFIAGVLMWPIVFKNLADRRERLVVGYFIAVYCLVMLAVMTERFSNLAPYTFNPVFRIF